MTEQTLVYVVTLSGVVLAVYDTWEAADNHRRFAVHQTKQPDTSVSQCIVRSRF